MALGDAAGLARWSGTVRAVRGGQVLEEVSVGHAAGAEGPPCTPDLRHQAGSISKLVVSTVVLGLSERRVLDLDRPITAWLPTAPLQWHTITLHQLLSQTSGLGHWGDVPRLAATFLTAPPTRADLVATIGGAPLVHEPGERWRYSGPGYLVAALVVEAATGAAYGEVAAELVFSPAGLRSTSSGRFPVGAPDVAVGHHEGRPVPVDPAFTQIPGTGDLWTTVDDLVRLNQALRSGRLLGDELTAQLWRPHARTGGPGASDDGPVVDEAYGYGTFLGRVRGHEARFTPGDNPGYSSLLAHLPGLDVDVAVLCNEDAPAVGAALARLSCL